MAWSAPRTWSIAETITHTLLNAESSANLNTLRALNDAAIRVYRTSAAQAIPTGVRTAISWQASAYQTGITWSAGTNPTRLTVPTTGIYLLDASIRWTSSASNTYGIGWHRGSSLSTQYDMQMHPGNGQDTTSGLELIDMVAGDYLEVYGYQDSGVNKNAVGAAEYETSASLHLLGVVEDLLPDWVPPRTWADGEILSPALLNTELRDNLRSLRSLKGAAAKVILTEDLSIGPNQRGAMAWGLPDFNVGGLWTGDSKFVAKVAGLYLISMHVEWLDSSATPLGCGYRINDSATNYDCQFQNTSGGTQLTSMVDLVMLAKDDVFEFYAYEDAVESSSIHGGTDDRTRAMICLMAAAS